jgi:hypothetical protein
MRKTYPRKKPLRLRNGPLHGAVVWLSNEQCGPTPYTRTYEIHPMGGWPAGTYVNGAWEPSEQRP